MRPGSCPRQPLSPSVPSRSVRQAIAAALPILLALILLPPLAFASPPDPTWVAGFYDGADGDDVVSLVYETSAANQIAPSHLGPLPCLLDMYLDGIVRNVPHCHFTCGPRSPPVIRSPEFVSIFNSLPPPPSFTEAPVTLRFLAKFCKEVEFATFESVAWYKTKRLLESLGYVPPAEYQGHYYRTQQTHAM